MTKEGASAHWLDGARKALQGARALYKDQNYALCLFHCHLAMEKVLKARLIEQLDMQDPPPTHDLGGFREFKISFPSSKYENI